MLESRINFDEHSRVRLRGGKGLGEEGEMEEGTILANKQTRERDREKKETTETDAVVLEDRGESGLESEPT